MVAEVLEDKVSRRELFDAEKFLREIFVYEPYTPIEEWVEQNISIPKGVTISSQVGPVKLDRFPFQRAVLRAFISPKYEEMWLRWGAQNSKTTLCQFILAWVIDQQPRNVMLGFSDKAFAGRRSNKHLKPLIEQNPCLARHKTSRGADFKTLSFKLKTCTIDFAWAGSSASLAGESCPVVIADEQDKWRHMDKKEAHPVQLLLDRMIAFPGESKAILASTPNNDDAPSEKAKQFASRHAFFVPCPHCGKPADLKDLAVLVEEQSQEDLKDRLDAAGYFVIKFEHFTGWGEERHPDKAADLAYIECPHCEGHIHDDDKPWMLKNGKAIPEDPKSSTFWFHLPGWYSPRVSIGGVVRKFYKALKDPDALQNWKNSVAADVWRQSGVEVSKDDILDHCAPYDVDMIPFVPLLVTMFVDVQQDEFWYVVRAWREHEGSALIRYGMLPRTGNRSDDPKRKGDPSSFSVLGPVIEKTFQASDGRMYGIDICGIDASAYTPDVYAYCRPRFPRVWPFQGADNLKEPLRFSRPETEMTTAGVKRARLDSVYLTLHGTKYFRDMLASRFAVVQGEPGAWMLPDKRHISSEYLRQFRAVRRVYAKRPRTGVLEYWWKTFGHDDHLYDCEEGCLVLAYVKNVRDMSEDDGHDDATVDPGEGGSFVRDGAVAPSGYVGG